MSDRQPAASAPTPEFLDHLVALLRGDDVDAAIEAGLMDAWPDACADALDDDARSLLLATRRRLREAWAARARYKARRARLAQRAAERDAGRRVPAPVVAADVAAPRSALPAGAAALLARAKARAGGGTP